MFTLKAKHWQVFLFTMLASLLTNFTIENDSLSTGILASVGILLYFGWFAVLGNVLFSLLPHDTGYSLTWFLLDCFVVIASWSAAGILTDSHNYHAEGLAALPGFYMMFAMIHVPWFLAVTLVAIEKQRKPEFGFYFGTFLLIVFWPIGVWFVQPRLNRIYRKTQENAQPHPLP